MARKRTIAAIAVATSILLAGGVIAATNAYADPQIIQCVKNPPDYMVYNTGVLAIKVTNAHLVQTYRNSDNVPINCLFEGDEYSRLFNGPWTYQGTYSYKRPYFEYV